MAQFGSHFMRLSLETAALIKGMLARGDSIEDIAVWFGLSFHIVHGVQSGALHPFLAPAPCHALPLPGPYPHASSVYSALADVQAAEQRLFDLRGDCQMTGNASVIYPRRWGNKLT